MLKFYEAFQKSSIPKNLENALYNEKEKLKILEEFNKINILVGANNSGKSLILREILKGHRNKYYGEKNKKEIICLIEALIQKYYKLYAIVGSSCDEVRFAHSHTVVYDFTMLDKQKDHLLDISADCDIEQKIAMIKALILQPRTISEIENQNLALYKTQNLISGVDQNQKANFIASFNELKEIANSTIDIFQKFTFPDVTGSNKIYIPSIRTLRHFAVEAKLSEKTIAEYEFGDIYIDNGQDLPQTIQDLKIAHYPDNKKLDAFQDFLSTEFFEKKPVRLNMPKGSNSSMTIKIGDEKERPIYQLGDGLQMIIILTFPFFNYDKGFIVIEEPELFIHPSLQKRFINFLCNHDRTENFQIFIATHSNHIVDSINITDKISLFTVKKRFKDADTSDSKISDFIIENVANADQTILKLLGITISSVYLANCTIWVEGITDRIYIQKYISEYLKQDDLDEKYKLCKNFQEGLNYSFSLTGGDSIIHWDFDEESEYEKYKHNIIVHKFCGKSFLIVDNDFDKNSKRKEFFNELLEGRFYELKVPEIENLLSADVIKDTILKYPSISEAVGIESLPQIDDDLFKKNKLGYIIDEILLKKISKVKKFSSKKDAGNINATLKSSDKYEFCINSLDYITFDRMSEDSIDLVEKILDFIKMQN
jgi:predicted ATPase